MRPLVARDEGELSAMSWDRLFADNKSELVLLRCAAAFGNDLYSRLRRRRRGSSERCRGDKTRSTWLQKRMRKQEATDRRQVQMQVWEMLQRVSCDGAGLSAGYCHGVCYVCFFVYFASGQTAHAQQLRYCCVFFHFLFHIMMTD
ncbi:uncharacterized protein Ecym_4268 [Eremothecium cymbalariae DBVPG|uniref:Uncharacterized protein n=1 Tax=Eremothecium cymbalariae (strain CBS 270.75 / DBVPG 7215 / KCTC 17166 / NRRL Y-17582) TaxID=931890 RepID=G8JTH9_ERECY|nr:hypothetical protein Ecym_4268 [Eremothecium cymbalariae DBVPG\